MAAADIEIIPKVTKINVYFSDKIKNKFVCFNKNVKEKIFVNFETLKIV